MSSNHHIHFAPSTHVPHCASKSGYANSEICLSVPAFIEASYYVSINSPGKAKPHDALYLAKSADIKATRRPLTDDADNYRLPPSPYKWEEHTKQLMQGFAASLSRSEQVNLEESVTSDIGAGTEFFASVLIMACSLIPYVGPLISTAGTDALEAMKGLRKDSTAEEAEAALISAEN